MPEPDEPGHRRSWRVAPVSAPEPQDAPEPKGYCAKCHRLQQKYSLLVGLLAAFTLWLGFNAGRPALGGPMMTLAACLAVSSALMFLASRFYPTRRPHLFWPSYAASLMAMVFGLVFFAFDYAEVLCGGPVANPFAAITGGGC